MRVWEEEYGADADGNRGVKMTMWELEDDHQERMEIAEKIILKGYNTEDTGTIEIKLEEIDVPVTIEEYHDEMSELEREDV